MAAEPPPGFLRLLVVFHEAELLGAATSVLHAVGSLSEYGWTASGWIPGEGPLTEMAAARLARLESHPRPLAFSPRGWKEPPGVRERLRRTPAYLRAFRTALLRIRPHVVHANTLLSLPEAWQAKRCGLPVVLHVHELVESAKGRGAARLASHVADVLVGVSEAASAPLRSRRAPVLTVRNGVPPPEATSAPPGGERGFRIGTIGTVSRHKGTDVFLEAASMALAERPELCFEHAGQDGLHRDDGLQSEVEQLLRRTGPAVTMLGRQAAEALLPSWDVFVLPSRSEAFPLATLEAMAAGLPVVASDVGGIPEQIEHLRTGVLVPPGDAAALATWIVRLHDDPELRARLGAEAAREARERFTVESQAAGLHEAYLAALNRRFAP